MNSERMNLQDFSEAYHTISEYFCIHNLSGVVKVKVVSPSGWKKVQLKRNKYLMQKLSVGEGQSLTMKVFPKSVSYSFACTEKPFNFQGFCVAFSFLGEKIKELGVSDSMELFYLSFVDLNFDLPASSLKSFNPKGLIGKTRLSFDESRTASVQDVLQMLRGEPVHLSPHFVELECSPLDLKANIHEWMGKLRFEFKGKPKIALAAAYGFIYGTRLLQASKIE